MRYQERYSVQNRCRRSQIAGSSLYFSAPQSGFAKSIEDTPVCKYRCFRNLRKWQIWQARLVAVMRLDAGLDHSTIISVQNNAAILFLFYTSRYIDIHTMSNSSAEEPAHDSPVTSDTESRVDTPVGKVEAQSALADVSSPLVESSTLLLLSTMKAEPCEALMVVSAAEKVYGMKEIIKSVLGALDRASLLKMALISRRGTGIANSMIYRSINYVTLRRMNNVQHCKHIDILIYNVLKAVLRSGADK